MFSDSYRRPISPHSAPHGCATGRDRLQHRRQNLDALDAWVVSMSARDVLGKVGTACPLCRPVGFKGLAGERAVLVDAPLVQRGDAMRVCAARRGSLEGFAAR